MFVSDVVADEECGSRVVVGSQLLHRGAFVGLHDRKLKHLLTGGDVHGVVVVEQFVKFGEHIRGVLAGGASDVYGHAGGFHLKLSSFSAFSYPHTIGRDLGEPIHAVVA